jgi:D-alanyl-D-alanine endopeptidase (penicillin-binding protein 7)
MSAMVYLDMNPDLTEVIEIAREDRKGARPAHTRLQRGWKLSADDLLHAALIASENPAIEALVRSTGLTRPEFTGLMNRKAQQLGMSHSIFFDASGLDANNTASARDVAKMLEAASKYPLIARITTMTDYEATVLNNNRKLHYVNSNRLARSSSWEVVTGKTGYISEAGYCLAVNAKTASDRKLLMVFLGAPARLSRFGDAARAVSWVEAGDDPVVSRE